MVPASLDQTRSAEDTYLTALRATRAFPDAFVSPAGSAMADADPWTAMQMGFRSAKTAQKKLNASNKRLRMENAGLKKRVEELEAQQRDGASGDEERMKRKRNESVGFTSEEKVKKRVKTSNGEAPPEHIRAYRADSKTGNFETHFQKQRAEMKSVGTQATSKEPFDLSPGCTLASPLYDSALPLSSHRSRESITGSTWPLLEPTRPASSPPSSGTFSTSPKQDANTPIHDPASSEHKSTPPSCLTSSSIYDLVLPSCLRTTTSGSRSPGQTTTLSMQKGSYEMDRSTFTPLTDSSASPACSNGSPSLFNREPLHYSPRTKRSQRPDAPPMRRSANGNVRGSGTSPHADGATLPDQISSSTSQSAAHSPSTRPVHCYRHDKAVSSAATTKYGHGSDVGTLGSQSAGHGWDCVKPHTNGTTANGCVARPEDALVACSTALSHRGPQSTAEADRTAREENSKIKKALRVFLHTVNDYEKVMAAFDSLVEFARSE